MSCCTYTVSNSVRIMAPVGHASWHGALAQCLQTSLCISQRSVLKKGRAVPGGVCAIVPLSLASAICLSNNGMGGGSDGFPSPICSINCTCRQVVALNCCVLSSLVPVQRG